MRTGERREVRGGKRAARRHFGIALLALCAAPAARAAGAYDELVAPIFRARCAECHGEQKQKAKLALHTWEGLVRGSDAGPVFVAGKPAASPLIERLRLPIDDDDHMPPKEKPQPSPEEIAILARWIERGASRELSVSDLQLDPRLAPAAAALPAKLAAIVTAQVPAEPLWEFDPAAVAKTRAPLAATVTELQRRFPGALSYESRTSATVLFTAAAFGRDFGDAELRALLPLRDQLVQLDLSGTGVTDASAETIARFAGLRSLRAPFTRLGDATADKLAALPRLESLSLSETAVTAASVPAFTRLRTLKALRVAGTPAAEAARAANLPVSPSAADLIPPAEPEKKPQG